MTPIALAVLTTFAALVGTGCNRRTSARIGEQFTLGDLSGTVKERRSQGQFVMPLGGEAIDAGREAAFVIVELELTNRGKATSAVALSSFDLETPEGVRYKPDVQGTIARAMVERAGGALHVDDPRGVILRPRIPTPYTVVFRVPYRAAAGKLALIVHQPSLLFGATAMVALQ